MSLGDRIREAREAKNMYQSQLAKLIGAKTPNIISYWEKGQSRPDVDKLLKLCEVLEVSPNDLLDYSEIADRNGILVLSPEEIRIIQDIRDLDEKGLEAVQAVLNKEKSRCHEMNNDSSSPKEYLSVPDESPFLEKGDPDYAVMKERCSKLKKLKKKTYHSYEDITRFLWNLGYGDKICIAFVIGVIAGRRVPNEQLYNCIRAYLEDDYHLSIKIGEKNTTRDRAISSE